MKPDDVTDSKCLVTACLRPRNAEQHNPCDGYSGKNDSSHLTISFKGLYKSLLDLIGARYARGFRNVDRMSVTEDESDAMPPILLESRILPNAYTDSTIALKPAS